VAAMREVPELSGETTQRLIGELEAGRVELIVFMTGVSVALLFEVADQLGQRSALVAALRRAVTVCRGPKPAAALRGFGVPATLTARSPYTSAELIDALSGVDLEGRRVLLLQCGQRSDTLAATLLARGAELDELWLYRWTMPENTASLEELVRRILDLEVDALAVTCQVQFRHLFEVAERMQCAAALVHTLNEHLVVGAVGPTCDAVLLSYGVRPSVIPEHPKMGPLVAALMRHMELRARQNDAPSPELGH
jgi:uroporphyrinogen-III synthase